jgi:sterol desaturase/sphingolipid hydroxylase (fatty acid hydroxylase superfamily)
MSSAPTEATPSDKLELAADAPAWRRVFYYAFLPALLLGYLAAVAFGGPLPWLLLFRLVIFAGEYIQPRRPDFLPPLRSAPWKGVKQIGKDVFYTVLTIASGLVPDLLGASVGLWLAAERARVVSFTLWPGSAPLGVRVALAIFVLENGAYWAHRVAHNTMLWQFHATHHAVREMYSLRTTRNHPLDIVWIGLPSIPLVALFGIGGEELEYAYAFMLAANVLAHANVLAVAPVLGWFVTLPQHHWVHHSRAIAESRSNYACGLILLDRIYGTFRAHGAPVVLGLDDRPADSLKAELLEPFYKNLAGDYRRPAPLGAGAKSAETEGN